MSRKYWPSPWEPKDVVMLIATLLVTIVVGLLYLDANLRMSKAATEETKLNAWTASVSELRRLYPRLLEASAGNRPLLNQPNFKLFDDLRLACKPFVAEPSQRIHHILVQMAACARQMRDGCSAMDRGYRTCWSLAEQLAEAELRYPPVRGESLMSVVRRHREYIAPNGAIAELTNLVQTGDSASILYVGGDLDLQNVIQSAVPRSLVKHAGGLHPADLPRYNLVVVDGGIDSLDARRIRSLVVQGCGLVMVGQAPYQLTGRNKFLGSIADWFGADFVMESWGSDITPAAGCVLDRKWDVPTNLPGPPSWRGGGWALSPTGLGPRTVVVSWCSDDIGVFSAAVLPDAERPGRIYYQGGLGERRCPELESLFASGVRWAAGLLQKDRGRPPIQ